MRKNDTPSAPGAGSAPSGLRILLAGAALTVIAAFLLLWHLDRPLLWQDVAETAIVAVNILERGRPTPWDGTHLVSQQQGRDALRVGDRILWAWHPWPQHYLAAAGLEIFGPPVGPPKDAGAGPESAAPRDAARTAAARLPFALIALLTVPLFYAWRLRREPWAIAAAGTAIYGLSIAFVLYSRQCRYYSLLFLGGLLVLWAYQGLDTPVRRAARRWTRGGLRVGALAVALAVVFYANPLTGLVLGVGLGLHTLVFQRRRLPRLLAAGSLFALLAAPWLALMLASDVRPPELGAAERLQLLAGQVWRFQYTLLPLALWPALAWIGWREARRPAAGETQPSLLSREILLLAVLASTLLVLVALQAPVGTARYLLPLWPLCAAVLAGLWHRIQARSALLGGVFLVVVVGTDLFPSLPAFPVTLARPAQTFYDREASALDKLAWHGRPGVPLVGFLRQQASPTRGPVAAVVRFVRRLESPPRVIAAAYSWESLHFYLGVPAVSLGHEAAGRERFGLPLVDRDHVDLLVPRRGWPTPMQPGAGFVKVDLGVPDDPYENLPDPVGARFGPSPLPSVHVWVRPELLPTGSAASTRAVSSSTGGPIGSR